MTGTKARTAIAACALVLAAASGQAGSALAAGRDGAHRCPTRQVSARAGVARQISIRCRLRRPARANRVNRAPAGIVSRPAEGRILGVDRSRNLVRYRARPGFAGDDRFVVVRRSRGVTWRLVVRVRVIEEGPLAPPANPKCGQPKVKETNYQTPAELTVTCTGNGLKELAIARGPANGSLRNKVPGGNPSSRTLTVTYVPNNLFVGGDGIKVEASEPGSSTVVPVPVKVLPWRMRAFGDSATAGFGFLGTTGKEIAAAQLEACLPPTLLNDRCSSNSDALPGSGGGPTWRPDFGLGNNISWAAQFANGWQGGKRITAPVMFQNHAVSGSTPADWLLPTGQLHGELMTIIEEDPDLIAFTLGVNPLLDMILENEEIGTCIRGSTNFGGVAGCLKKPFETVELQKMLVGTYKALLAAPDAEVVTFQYHLAFPSVAAFPDLFLPWQIEAAIFSLNGEIATAIAAARAALPKQANRLTLIEAQVDPNQPDPLKVPRFDLGIPPKPARSWLPKHTCTESKVAVDGESHQASAVQAPFRQEYPGQFCKGTPWIISADTGIHPNQTGYAQFAKTLENVASADGLVPKLP